MPHKEHTFGDGRSYRKLNGQKDRKCEENGMEIEKGS